MGLFKWLKKEVYLTPSPKKNISKLSSNENDSELSRDESYIRALCKFNKWRQRHSSAHCKIKTKTVNDEYNSYAQKFDCCQMIYEDIDKISKELDCFSNVKTNKSVNGNDILILSTSYEINKENLRYSNNNAEYFNINNSINEFDTADYALPFMNDIEGFDLLLNKFQKNQFSSYLEEYEEPLLITDLDKSQDTINKYGEISYEIDKSESLDKLEFFSELLVCHWNQINFSREGSEFNILNGYIQSGEIDFIEVSVLKLNEDSNNSLIFNNLKALRKLRHPNILLLMGVSVNRSSILEALLLEPLNCTLYEVIHLQKNRLPIEICQQIAIQITNAVTYLHKNNFIHTNIFSKNIFICKDARSAKLGGFELHTIVNEEHSRGKNISSTNFNSQLTMSLEQRKKYTMHFYQAPEILCNEGEYINPTYETDVYGICITLWEMLNCAIPYLQYSYNDLIKVFSLKNAQPTVYEEERNMPFKNLLENGLTTQTQNRIPNTIVLKNLLEKVDIFAKDTMQINTKVATNVWSKSKGKKQTRNANRNRIDNSKCKSCEVPFLCDSAKSWNLSKKIRNRNKKKINCTCKTAITCSKRYRMNIVITSKSRPHEMTINEHCLNNLSNASVDECPDVSNVREKINKFELFSSSPHLYSQLDCSEFLVDDVNKIVRKSNNMKEDYKSSFLDSRKSSNMKEDYRTSFLDCRISELNQKCSGHITKKQYEMISTNDFYIDDDFPTGVNFELYSSYL